MHVILPTSQVYNQVLPIPLTWILMLESAICARLINEGQVAVPDRLHSVSYVHI